MIDSSVLLPEPEAPTIADSFTRLQGKIDVLQNLQRACGIGHRLEYVLYRDNDIRHEFFFATKRI